MFDPTKVVVDEPLGPGQYRFIETQAWTMTSGGPSSQRYCYLEETIVRVWVPADQRQDWLLEHQLTGRRLWLLGSEKQVVKGGDGISGASPSGRWRAPYGDFFALDDGREPGTREAGWQQPTEKFLAALPREPRELYERLKADSPPDRTGYRGPFVYATDVLRTGLVPADLRVAMYRALLLTPGVQLMEADGRSGEQEVSFTLNDGVYRRQIFISSAGGQFSGERSTLTQDTRDLKAGTVTTSTVVRIATVDAIGGVPPEG